MLYSCEKSILRKKCGTSHSDITVSCTIQESDNVTPYYPVFIQPMLTGRLRQVKNKRKFQIFSSKVVAVTYDRWLLTKGFEYNDLTLKILENWSLRRGFSSLTRDGCNQRLECMKKKT